MIALMKGPQTLKENIYHIYHKILEMKVMRILNCEISALFSLFLVTQLDDNVHINLGANLTLTNLKDLFETIDDPGVMYGKEFSNHIQYISSTGIRNVSYLCHLLQHISHIQNAKGKKELCNLSVKQAL